MTSLEQVITTMVKIFREYAQSKGDKHKLCKDELQTLLKKEIQNPKFKVGTIKVCVSMSLFCILMPD